MGLLVLTVLVAVPYAIRLTRDDPVTAQAHWMLAQLGLLGIAAVYGGLQLREAQRLRQEQARPYISVDLDPWSEGIPMLVPGKRMTCLLDVIHKALAGVADGDVPGRYVAQVTYSDLDGNRYGPEEYPLNLETYKGLLVKVRDDDHTVVIEARQPLPVQVVR